MPSGAPHHRPSFPVRCIVRIDEHGSKDRVKDASRSACDGVPCLRPAPTLSERRTTAFPSSASFGHPLSPARSIPAEEAACTDHEPTKASIPSDAPRSAPPSRRPGCLSPPRHAREFVAERLLPPALTPALSLTPPTLYPQVGESALVGHCKCHGAVTRDP
jgi:hypothetical protein